MAGKKPCSTIKRVAGDNQKRSGERYESTTQVLDELVASGLIDASLFSQDKTIQVYTHQELQKVSPYYQQLISSNKVELDVI